MDSYLRPFPQNHNKQVVRENFEIGNENKTTKSTDKKQLNESLSYTKETKIYIKSKAKRDESHSSNNDLLSLKKISTQLEEKNSSQLEKIKSKTSDKFGNKDLNVADKKNLQKPILSPKIEQWIKEEEKENLKDSKKLENLVKEGEFFAIPIEDEFKAPSIEKNLKETVSLLDGLSKDENLKGPLEKIAENLEQLNSTFTDDRLNKLQPIWNQLKEVEQTTSEKLEGLSLVMGMIIIAMGNVPESKFYEKEVLSQLEKEMEEVIAKFEGLTLELNGGQEIFENAHIIFENIKINQLSQKITLCEKDIEEKESRLKKDPNNETLKLEISKQQRKFLELEDKHFKKTMSITKSMTKSPIDSLKLACETLTKIFPSFAHAGLESAINVLSFLGGSIGVVTAAVQIHKHKENISKIKKIQDNLKGTVKQLEKKGVPQSTLKLLNQRIENLGKGRLALEASNLVAAVIKWTGTTGSSARSLLIATATIKGTLVSKAAIGLSAGTILIPAAIGGIAYLRLQRAQIWKKYKELNDRNDVELSNRLLIKQGQRYEKLIHHPYFGFIEKVNNCENLIEKQKKNEIKIKNIISEIVNNMSEKIYEQWKKEDKESVDIADFAPKDLKNELVKLRNQVKVNNQFLSKFYYDPMITEDKLLSNYIALTKELRTSTNEASKAKIKEKLIVCKMKIAQKDSRLQEEALELKRNLKTLLNLQRGSQNKIAFIEDEYLKRMVFSHTKLNQTTFKALTDEITLLWKDVEQRKEIETFFWENHREVYMNLRQDPIKTLVKWVSGIQL